MGNRKKINQVLFGKDFKFLTIALFLTLLFSIFSCISIIISSRQAQIQKSYDEGLALNNTIEQVVSAKITDAVEALGIVQDLLEKNNFNYKKLDPFILSQELLKIKNNFNTIELLALIDENGDGYAISHWAKKESYLNRKKINVKDREYFQRHLKNVSSGIIISDPQISKTLGTEVITVNKRIPSANGEFKGIITLTINLDFFTQSFKTIVGKKLNTITLLNEKRGMISRYPKYNNFVGKTFSADKTEIEANQLNPEYGYFITSSQVDHGKKFFVYKKMATYNFIIFFGKPIDDVLHEWKIITLISISFTLIFIFSVLYFFKKYIAEFIKSEDRKIELLNSARMSSLGLMAASIAHEINNPLLIISGRANQGLKLMKDENADKERIKQNFSKIIDASGRMAKIINGIKIIARDGKSDRFTDVYLRDIVNYLLDFVTERFKNSGVELRVADLPEVLLYCRESQIAQVLVNLVNNSFDAIEPLNEKWIEINFKVENNYLKIFVIDSGKGIPTEISNKMFNSVFTSKEIGKGTGLGLYISQQIIDEHSGRLFLDKTAKNTTFVIELFLSSSVLPK